MGPLGSDTGSRSKTLLSALVCLTHKESNAASPTCCLIALTTKQDRTYVIPPALSRPVVVFPHCVPFLLKYLFLKYFLLLTFAYRNGRHQDWSQPKWIEQQHMESPSSGFIHRSRRMTQWKRENTRHGCSAGIANQFWQGSSRQRFTARHSSSLALFLRNVWDGRLQG